jgi:hypothetical protein
MRIGIDFDNTIAGYDSVFVKLARQTNLLGDDCPTTKKAIRDLLRTQVGGETTWQRLQGMVYGAGMAQAELLDGVAEFLTECRTRGISTFIVSHKTQFNNFDPDQIDLRSAAWRWMSDKGFFAHDGIGLARDRVFFEGTRAEKLARIVDLECTYFIDDLEEVFREPEFPKEIKAILYAPNADSAPGPYEAIASWQQISRHIFG